MASLIRFSQILCLSFMLLRFRVQSSSPSQSSPDSSPHLCRPEERSALLDFKSTTNLVERCPLGATPRPKTQTWNESKDCCLWEGITCDKVKGHVIGLDLSSNCLRANLTTNSSLFRLEKLQSLNLSFNYFHYPNISFGFDRWKGLQYLNLSSSAGSGPRVGYFNMDGSLLFGEIFLLAKLVSLDVSYHHGLLLDNIKFQMLVHNLTELRFLVLNYVNMSLIVPSSLLNLTSSLKHLSLWNCNLQGNIPNQVFQLPSLQHLDLSYNFDLGGNLPKSNQSSTLEYLNLGYTNFSGELPHSIGNLKLLKELNLGSCQFYGSIPRSLANLTEITQLDFSFNYLQGQIPDVFGKIPKLTDLRLDENNFGGEIPASIFNLTHLTFLSLSSNKLIGPLPHNISGLSPYLFYLNLRSNLLQGSLPILTTREYMEKLLISENNLTGEIPPSYCNLTSLRLLILANNSLGGNIPECLGNLSVLTILDLQMNKFHGRIPNLFVNNSILLTLSLNGNQLEGILSRSLVNCSELEILDVGNNNLNDTFPHWLGVLPSLKVLILRSNQFHGAINNSMPAFYFPQLRIIDVAQNDFMGLLPSNYFKILKGMRDVAPAEKKYLDYIGSRWQCFRSEGVICLLSGIIYMDSVKVVIKGSVRDVAKISKIFTIIDFSSNQFRGPIPEELGELNSLLLLNLSHNSLNGQIPSSLGKLAELESLDLSSNKLEGRIPEQLTMLTFLSSLNLSHNELVGHIPEGKQFSTFSNDSYVGNSGLCGFPLTKKCEEPRSSSSQFDEEDGSTAVFEWKFALAGYGCGLVLGLSMGYIAFTTGKPRWVVKKVEKYQQKLVGKCN